MGIELAVPAEFDGQRIDRFLVSVLEDYSRSQIQKLIADGHVEVRRGASSRLLPAPKPNLLVHEADQITVATPEVTPSAVAAEALPLDIVYQDSDLAVLNKPAGMVIHPGAGHASGTLVNALLHHLPDLSGIGGEKRPGIVHRLDRGTSGLMVIAKHDAAHHELARQFHDREVEKEYVALVWGVVQAGRRIDAAIGRDPANRQKMSARARHAREAVTRITRAHHMPGLTLCQVAIHTGRTHQIRVQSASRNHPVIGDAQYGSTRPFGEQFDDERLRAIALHARQLGFNHPMTNELVDVIAPLSPAWSRLGITIGQK